MASKLIVIGLDGATWTVLDHLISQGQVPHIAKLIQQGAKYNLRSVHNQNSAPAWTSFATGVNPGKHGIYYFSEPVLGTYERRYLKGSDRSAPTFWQIASAADKRLCIINVPMSFPSDPINGVMISGLDAPSDDTPGLTYPADLLQKLRPELGEYIIEPGIPSILKRGAQHEVLSALQHSIESRLRYSLHLLKSDNWDIFVTVFTDSDAAHHVFWQGTAADLANLPLDAQQSITTIYEQLDRAVGELVQCCPEASFAIMSDHGGGFNQRGAEYLQSWLLNAGYLNIRPAPVAHTLAYLYQVVDRTLGRSTKQKLAALLPWARARVENASTMGTIDWARTRVYANNQIDEVWINLKGREPSGVVDPSDYMSLCNEMIDELQKAVDPVTGKPIVEYAWTRDQIYDGPPELIAKAADITIRWRTDFILSGIQSPRGSSDLSLANTQPLVTGGHRPDGILILSGPGFKPNFQLGKAFLIDLAPTILHLFGLPVPTSMDGRVLTEALSESRPITFTDTFNQPPSPNPQDYTPDQEKTIHDRLKALGYVD